ncbi:unnamed protein product [marine sediment metagenome]|uniref:Uncharacterized protein n=1 Tax=marine sediment metagenome TaxID=412755 RepID=X1R6E3_9ZZZZ
MIHLKKCKKCGELFDIDTSKDLCPKCRKKEVEDGKEKRII